MSNPRRARDVSGDAHGSADSGLRDFGGATEL